MLSSPLPRGDGSIGIALFVCSGNEKSRRNEHEDTTSSCTINRGPWFRSVQAKTNIPKNSIILREFPLIVVPSMMGGSAREDLRVGHDFSCLGCCRISHLTSDSPLCLSCCAPLCSLLCQFSKFHRDECRVMTESGFQFGVSHPEITWGDFLNAVSVFRHHIASKLVLKNISDIVGGASSLRPTEFALFVRMQTITKLVFGCNTIDDKIIKQAVIAHKFYHMDYEVPEKGISAYPLFYNTCFINHSCRPNTELVPLGGLDIGEFEICLRALSDIPKGAELLISRVSIQKPTFIRRAILFSKNISCMCERCSDPTEMGQYVGSMCCNNCRGKGIMSLLVPLDPLKESKWKCQYCKNLVTYDEVFDSYIDARSLSDDISFRNVKEKEKYLRQEMFPLGRMHPSHYFISLLKLNLSNKYNNGSEDMQHLKRKIELLKEIYNIFDHLKEGSSFRKASNLLALCQSLIALHRISKDKDEPFKCRDRLKYAHGTFIEAKEILQPLNRFSEELLLVEKTLMTLM